MSDHEIKKNIKNVKKVKHSRRSNLSKSSKTASDISLEKCEKTIRDITKRKKAISDAEKDAVKSLVSDSVNLEVKEVKEVKEVEQRKVDVAVEELIKEVDHFNDCLSNFHIHSCALIHSEVFDLANVEELVKLLEESKADISVEELILDDIPYTPEQIELYNSLFSELKMERTQRKFLIKRKINAFLKKIHIPFSLSLLKEQKDMASFFEALSLKFNNLLPEIKGNIEYDRFRGFTSNYHLIDSNDLFKDLKKKVKRK